jgi:hypothetical protein
MSSAKSIPDDLDQPGAGIAFHGRVGICDQRARAEPGEDDHETPERTAHRPILLDGSPGRVQEVLHRCRSEFAVLEAPAPVRRLVFPALIAIGSLLGFHRRFAGAPGPVTRPSRGYQNERSLPGLILLTRKLRKKNPK